MALYYKFKSAKYSDSIPVDGRFISVACLKDIIFHKKRLGSGRDFDLIVSDPLTNEEYTDEATLLPRHSSVLVKRIPGHPLKPIVILNEEEEAEPMEIDEAPEQNSSSSSSSSVELDFYDFGSEVFDHEGNLIFTSEDEEEETKIKALIDTTPAPAPVPKHAKLLMGEAQKNYGPGRSFGRRKTPPQGYICHRCRTSGHFIQHCPTNGRDPADVIIREYHHRPAAAFEERRPSVVLEIPPELHCHICKQIMKNAVMTKRCCFTSFCDECIRDRILSKSVCACGYRNILADDLLPNIALRRTIDHFLRSGATSSSSSSGTRSSDILDAPSAFGISL